MTAEVPIVFSSNEGFVPYMSAMLQSIIEHSNIEKEYLIFILYSELKDSTMQKLQEQSQKYQNFKISFFNVNEYVENYNFYIPISSYSKEVYFRLLIPWLFSKYEKIIYLDGDMIAKIDIAELLDIDMGENFLMASRHSCVFTNKSLESIKKRWFEKPENYFCSGLLVFNTKKFTGSFSMQELLEFANSRNWPTVDQDMLNVLCYEKTLLLDSSWNFLAGHYSQERLDSLIEPWRSDFENAKLNPKIIHFTNGEFYRGKPDKSPFYILYVEYFWKHALKTPFIEQIISDMYCRGFFQNDTFAQSVFLADNLGIKPNLKLAVHCLSKVLKEISGKIKRKIFRLTNKVNKG